MVLFRQSLAKVICNKLNFDKGLVLYFGISKLIQFICSSCFKVIVSYHVVHVNWSCVAFHVTACKSRGLFSSNLAYIALEIEFRLSVVLLKRGLSCCCGVFVACLRSGDGS